MSWLPSPSCTPPQSSHSPCGQHIRSAMGKENLSSALLRDFQPDPVLCPSHLLQLGGKSHQIISDHDDDHQNSSSSSSPVPVHIHLFHVLQILFLRLLFITPSNRLPVTSTREKYSPREILQSVRQHSVYMGFVLKK